MLEDFTFLAICAFFFLFGIGLICMVDFLSYVIFNFSLLFWLEKFFFEKLGK